MSNKLGDNGKDRRVGRKVFFKIKYDKVENPAWSVRNS